MKLCSSVKFFSSSSFISISFPILLFLIRSDEQDSGFSSVEAYVCTRLEIYIFFPFQSPNYIPVVVLHWKFNIIFSVNLWFISWAITESSNSITLELRFGYFFLNELYAITYTKFHYIFKMLSLLAILIHKRNKKESFKYVF